MLETATDFRLSQSPNHQDHLRTLPNPNPPSFRVTYRYHLSFRSSSISLPCPEPVRQSRRKGKSRVLHHVIIIPQTHTHRRPHPSCRTHTRQICASSASMILPPPPPAPPFASSPGGTLGTRRGVPDISADTPVHIYVHNRACGTLAHIQFAEYTYAVHQRGRSHASSCNSNHSDFSSV
jgi:hypothetical protein